jgi:hypothetical protein
MISLMVDKYLGFILQAPEGCGMDYTIPVSLKAISGLAFRLVIITAPTIFRKTCKRG